MREVYDARPPREGADVFRRVLVPVLLVAVTALAFGIAARWSVPAGQRPGGVRLTFTAAGPVPAAASGAPELAAPAAGDALPLPAPAPPAPAPEQRPGAPAPTLTVVHTVVVVAPEATPSASPSPSPSAAPTPTRTPSAATTPATPDAWPLTAEGAGPLTLGLDARTAAEAGYLVADPAAPGGYATSPALAGVLSVEVAGGAVRALVITGAGPRTPEGAGVGTPLTDLAASYGAALVSLPLPDAAGAIATVPGLDCAASTIAFVPEGDAVGRVIIAAKPDASPSPATTTTTATPTPSSTPTATTEGGATASATTGTATSAAAASH